jgi:hypothetical protein
LSAGSDTIRVLPDLLPKRWQARFLHSLALDLEAAAVISLKK